MRILDKIEEKRRCFFHGGSPVLYLHTHTPTGTAPAALHLTKLIELLADYTETRLLPSAVAALQDAVAHRQGYRFFPHRVCAFLSAASENGQSIALTFSLQTGDGMVWSRELITHWNEAGTLQASASPHQKKHRHA